MNPLISIIIPSYNKVKYIKKTLDSIFSQSYKNFEVIIQDGASTDGTLEIIKQYAKKYSSFVQHESKKDGGQLDAINKGLKKAKGEIVTYINADDVYTSGAFESVAGHFIENPDALWFAGKGIVIDENDIEIAKLATVYKSFLLSLNAYSLLLMANYLMQPSVFLTKKAIKKYGMFTGTKFAVMEYDMWLKIGKDQIPVVINKVLTHFRMEKDTKTSINSAKLLLEDEKIVKRYTKNVFVLAAHKIINLIRIVILNLLNINYFFILFSITYFLLAIESVSYIGYVKKFVLFDSRFYLVFTSIFCYLNIQNKKYSNKFILNINKMIIFLSSLSYLILQFIESSKYNNYIFFKYHINPDNVLNIIFFGVTIYLINRYGKYLKLSLFNITIIFMLFLTAVNNLFKTANMMVKTNLFVLNHLNYSYDQKMTNYWGYYYDYMSFVKKNTPEDSTILIPPQEGPWYNEGNGALDRYFLYPRSLRQGTYDTANIDNIDYIMIAWGSWNIEAKERYGWPKVEVKAEKLIYVNNKDGSLAEYNDDYDPKDIKNIGGWGLIKLKND